MHAVVSFVGALLLSWPRSLRRRPQSISPTRCPISCKALAACAMAPPSVLSCFELSTASLQMATCKLSWRLTLSTLSILQTDRPHSTRLLAPPRVTTIRAGSRVVTRFSPSWAFGTYLVTGGPCMILLPPCDILGQMVRYTASRGLQGDSKVTLLRCCGSAPPSVRCGQGLASLARSRARVRR